MKKLSILVLALALAIPSVASAKDMVPVKPKPVAGKTFGGGGGPWLIFACAGGIITAALVANATQNRELTWDEAASCGLFYAVHQ